MRRIWICASLCTIAMALFVSAVHATSSIARATGKDCGYCHVDTGGGGTLTAAGQYYLSHGTLPPAAPTAPTALAATAASATQINLSWTDNSSDETGFKVERATSASGPWSSPATLAAGVRTYSSTGLTASTLYYYRVYAYNGGGNSGYATGSATTQAATPVPTVPTAPTGLTATAASATQINLRWTDTSSNETGFKVERASSTSGPWSALATLGAGVTTYSHTGLTASTGYSYRVCAYNATGNSGYVTASATTQAPPPPTPTAPAAPTSLTATTASATQINLSWADGSNNETGFKVERASSTSGPWSALATLGAGVTTYSNTGLTASTAYSYRVYAYNATGNSGNSNTASATTQAVIPPPPTPTAPTSLTATAASTSQINLRWTDSSNNETGFKVSRGSSASGPWTALTTTAAGATTYSSTGLTASTPYYYRVCATNATGDSGYATSSATTQAVTPPPPSPTAPAAPTGFGATAVATNRIDLRWTDNSNNETGFRVQKSMSASGPWSSPAVIGAGVTSYTSTSGLTAGTTYYYRVCAYNASGESSYTTASATTLAGTTPPPPPTTGKPTAPSGLRASASSTSQINLTWSDNSGNETGFRIQRSLRPDASFVTIASLAAGKTSYVSSRLRANTTYYYRVCAFNGRGYSAFSNVSSAKTRAWTPPPSDDDDDDERDDD